CLLHNIAVVGANIQSGINFASEIEFRQCAADEWHAGMGCGENVAGVFALELDDVGVAYGQPELFGGRTYGAAELETRQTAPMNGAICIGRFTLEGGPDHPADFAVVDGAFADEFDPRAKNEIAFHFLPEEMELIASEPHVGACSGECVFL